jgi:hypothetical protein
MISGSRAILISTDGASSSSRVGEFWKNLLVMPACEPQLQPFADSVEYLKARDAWKSISTTTQSIG